MPILRLVAEGVGPFERIDVDFSDGNGNPHLGPHIVVGTNGTGKSTLLRTIAWGFAQEADRGFDFETWEQCVRGHSTSRAAMSVIQKEGVIDAYAAGLLGQPGTQAWAQHVLQQPLTYGFDFRRRGETSLWWSGNGETLGPWLLCATYRPSPTLRLLREPDLASRLRSGMEGALSFQGTVDNAKLQAWLMRLYSERAIAATERLSPEHAQAAIGRLEQALNLMFGSEFRIKVHVPGFELQLETSFGTSNVSQLPDGLRSTLGWCADFLMRRDRMHEDGSLGSNRPGILLIDEIESHLHPHWQRRILPGLRKALPDVQIIVTTHSPFVASSCPGAKLHICERVGNGPATVRPAQDGPFGEDILSTIDGVFGVESRFDIETECDLDRWHRLKKNGSNLSPTETRELNHLTDKLSARSEDLRAIVDAPSRISPEMVSSLINSTAGKRRRSIKK